MHTGRGWLLTLGFLSLFAGGCSLSLPTQSLPNASDLGSPRGYRIARTLTHFHSPYSYDACDKNGLSGTTPNSECYAHLVRAMCLNRVDFLFITDHPDHMQDYEMRDLLIVQDGDTVLNSGTGDPYAKRVGSCENGFQPVFLLGFESRLMPLGITKHLDAAVSDRKTNYQLDTAAIRARLQTETDAVVAVPHTEHWSVDSLRTLQPDAIEIYNFHANIDPKIRRTYLNAPPFTNIASFLTYLIDPYKQLVPDYGFLSFLQTFPVYFSIWNSLIDGGLHVTGLGGTDSHENVFPQIVSDGERLDSHRRVTRMMSNHFLVNDLNISTLKSAIRAGRGWLVFEGLGTPVGMDFYATVSGTTVGVGETGTLGGASATITVLAPHLHADSPQSTENPVFKLKLKRVLSGGNDEVVASSEGQDLSYSTTQSGAYRAEITIIPKHIRKYLSDFSDRADQEYSWIITNHLYLNP